MPSLTQVLLASAFAAVGLAVPTKQGFSVQQVPKNIGFLTAGPHATLKTYKKFGKQPPTAVVQAAALQSGTVAATPEEYDSEYLCPVDVGGTTLNLDFDTGSSDL